MTDPTTAETFMRQLYGGTSIPTAGAVAPVMEKVLQEKIEQNETKFGAALSSVLGLGQEALRSKIVAERNLLKQVEKIKEERKALDRSLRYLIETANPYPLIDKAMLSESAFNSTANVLEIPERDSPLRSVPEDWKSSISGDVVSV